jgi:hypothetical protein
MSGPSTTFLADTVFGTFVLETIALVAMLVFIATCLLVSGCATTPAGIAREQEV